MVVQPSFLLIEVEMLYLALCKPTKLSNASQIFLILRVLESPCQNIAPDEIVLHVLLFFRQLDDPVEGRILSFIIIYSLVEVVRNIIYDVVVARIFVIDENYLLIFLPDQDITCQQVIMRKYKRPLL
jgi:hypothetical protein